MKRIAENIAKAFWTITKGNKESISRGLRYYDSNPRDRADVDTLENKEDVDVRGEHTFEQAYASGANSAKEIQYC